MTSALARYAFNPQKFLMRSVLLTVSTLLTLVLIELSVRLLVHSGVLKVPPPPRANSKFWDPAHEEFGVWHQPNATEIYRGVSFSITYRTNSIGARDIERRVDSSRSRVVVLGDSFIEGWGLLQEQRVSNLLESSTGIEHLNFGMSHFGPYQYFLVYHKLAKKYSHNAILIGILPLNDFWDLDYEAARTSFRYEYRFRPYLIDEYPQYHRFDYRERMIQQFFRRRFYTFNAMNVAYRNLHTRRSSVYDRLDVGKSVLYPSYYYDIDDKQFNLLRYCIEMILRESSGKRVAIVLIPTFNDFMRYHQDRKPRLAQNLAELATNHPSLRVLDLLPPMYQQAHYLNFNKYFHANDFHWNAYGNRTAMCIIKQELADFIYPLKEQSPDASKICD